MMGADPGVSGMIYLSAGSRMKNYVTRDLWDAIKALPNFHELLAKKGQTEDDYIVIDQDDPSAISACFPLVPAPDPRVE